MKFLIDTCKKSPEEGYQSIIQSIEKEVVETSKSILELDADIERLYAVIYEKKDARENLYDILTRLIDAVDVLKDSPQNTLGGE